MTEKEENITEATWEELQEMEDLTDWERVKNMTEEEVEQNALDDPDAQPLPEGFEKEAWVAYPYQQDPQNQQDPQRYVYNIRQKIISTHSTKTGSPPITTLKQLIILKQSNQE